MRPSACLFAIALCLPALASNPGEPLDCSDWVAVEPGVLCDDWLVDAGSSPWATFLPGDGKVPDNEGNLIRVYTRFLGEDPGCGKDIFRTQVVRFDGQAEEVVAQLRPGCDPHLEVEFLGVAALPEGHCAAPLSAPFPTSAAFFH